MKAFAAYPRPPAVTVRVFWTLAAVRIYRDARGREARLIAALDPIRGCRDAGTEYGCLSLATPY
jgi:hypothetical protein